MRDPGFVLQVEHLLVQEVRRRSMGQEGRFDLLDPSLPLERSNEDGIGASDYIDYYDMSFATALFFLLSTVTRCLLPPLLVIHRGCIF